MFFPRTLTHMSGFQIICENYDNPASHGTPLPSWGQVEALAPQAEEDLVLDQAIDVSPSSLILAMVALLSVQLPTSHGPVIFPQDSPSGSSYREPETELSLLGRRFRHALKKFGIAFIWRLISKVYIMKYLLFHLLIYKCPHHRGLLPLSSIHSYIYAKHFWSFTINLCFATGLFLILLFFPVIINKLSSGLHVVTGDVGLNTVKNKKGWGVRICEV